MADQDGTMIQNPTKDGHSVPSGTARTIAKNKSIDGDAAGSPTSVKVSHTSFPYKLYELLEDAETQGFDHIVSWLPCGTALKVHSQRRFEEEGIMSRYFKQTRYKSFQKQLNLYKFQRTPDGINKGSYSHDLFVRGKKDQCKLISRAKTTPQPNTSSTNSHDGENDNNIMRSSRQESLHNIQKPSEDSKLPAAQDDSSSRRVNYSTGSNDRDHFAGIFDENGPYGVVAAAAATATAAGRTAGRSRPTSHNVGNAVGLHTYVPDDIIDEIIFTFGSRRNPP